MRLSISTPRGAVVDTEVDVVTAPGAEGELGILPGHLPLMTALRPGVFVYQAKERVVTYAVGEGFMQVAPQPAAAGGGTQDQILVLVDQALPASGIDRTGAEQDLASLEAQLAGWKRDLDADYQALLVRRNWAAARLDAALRSTPH